MNRYRLMRLDRLGLAPSLRLVATACLMALAVMPAAADVDAEKFMAAMDKLGAEQAARTPGAQLYQNCVYCHGEQGRAESSFYPRLAGQPADYLRQQLQAYRQGQRQNAIMSSMALALSGKEIDLLVTYLAAQSPRPGDAPADHGAQVTAGQARAVALGCVACHGNEYQGQGSYARLAGQGYDYLVSQLTDFRDGQRRDPTAVMPGLAAALSDQDIENLSRYFSGL